MTEPRLDAADEAPRERAPLRFCVDCRWIERDQLGQPTMPFAGSFISPCLHPAAQTTEVDLVTGRETHPRWQAAAMRNVGACGREARYFQTREEPKP